MNTQPLNPSHPMAQARIVRMEKYAWPGGYAMALITTDGGALCPQCLTENWPQVSSAHRSSTNDGWRPAGIIAACETDEEIRCDHCSKVIIEGAEE